MVEFNGIIDKIEKSNISNLDIVTFKTENGQTQMRLELVNKINPFKENDIVKIVFDTKPISNEGVKLALKGFIFSIKTQQKKKSILIPIGGLNLNIETSENVSEFKVKQNINISFF